MLQEDRVADWRAHDKALYQLCNYMEPRYHQLEFEVRVYLTHLEVSGARLWGATEVEAPCGGARPSSAGA